MKIVFAESIGLTPDQKRAFCDEMKTLGHSVVYFDNLPANQDDLCNRVNDANVIVVSNYPVSAEVVQKSSGLKMIAVAFTGVDHIPTDLCKEKRIAVFNAAGYSTQAVAELTIALAIDLYRKVVPFDGITRTGGTRNGFLGGELNGKVFGIVGFGAIGQRVAKLAQAFDCKIIVWTRTRNNFEGIDFVDLDKLLAKSDIVSLHLPLTDTTRGLINEERLRLMKPSSLFINTARGPIVDYMALSTALKSGVIAGAAVDVYEQEPPIEDHPIFSAPNTILLPHIGFATKEAIQTRSIITMENIKEWLKNNSI